MSVAEVWVLIEVGADSRVGIGGISPHDRVGPVKKLVPYGEVGAAQTIITEEMLFGAVSREQGRLRGGP